MTGIPCQKEKNLVSKQYILLNQHNGNIEINNLTSGQTSRKKIMGG